MATDIKRCRGLRVTAVVDPDPADRAWGGSQFAVDERGRHADVSEALASGVYDAAIINTPTRSHLHIARTCIDAGLDVLVAKPLDLDPQAAAALLYMAEGRRRSVSVIHQMRYLPLATEAKRLVESGRLGTVEAIRVVHHKDRRDGRGRRPPAQITLVEFGIHHLDLVIWLANPARPRRIQTVASSTHGGGPTTTFSLLDLGSIVATVELDTGRAVPRFEMDIVGTLGSARFAGSHIASADVRASVVDASGARSSIPLARPRPYAALLADWADRWARGIGFGDGRSHLVALTAAAAALRSLESERSLDLDSAGLFAPTGAV